MHSLHGGPKKTRPQLYLTVIFVMPEPVSVIMAALCSRCGHYIFAPWFLLSIFLLFFSPNLSGGRVYVYHTPTHGVALVRI